MTARPGFSSRATGDAAALLLLLGAVAVLFLPALTARGLLFFGDTTNYALRLDYTGQWLKAGRFPLWNPLLSLGAPHAVDTGAQTFYPPHVLLALLFGDRVYDFDAAFHVFLAAVGMFAWARTLRCSRAAALLAALAYSMGGFALGHLQHLAILVALGWIPVVLASTERYLLTSERRFLGLTAWAVGLLLLGGHPQISLYGLSALGCYGLFRLATLRRTLSDARPLRLAGGLALSLALGLAVASLFLLPFGEWMHFVSRTERVTSEYATAFSLPTKRIWTMVAPFWFGGSPDRPQQAWQLIERSSYVGLLPLALAAVALARPTAPVLFLWGLASLALLLALGDKTPLYDLVLLVPVFRSVRAPARFLALSGLALALLAGRGLDTLRTGGGRRTARSIALAFLALVASVGIAAWLGWEAAWPLPARGDRVRLGQADTWTLVSMLCGAAALLWRLAARRGVQARVLALCLGFVALDLFSFKARLFFYRPAPWTAYEEPSATARVLEGGGGAPRLFTRTGTELETMVYEDGDFHGYRRALWESLRASLPMRFGLGSLSGYLAEPPAHQRLLSFVKGRTLFDSRAARIVGAFGVGYVISSPVQPVSAPELTLLREGVRNLYRNEAAVPRAYLVPGQRIVADEVAAFSVVKRADFEPRETVVLESPGAALPEGPRVVDVGRARIVLEEPDRVVVRTASGRPAWLVLNDSFAPGWTADVDGRRRTILRANSLVRAVPLEAGRHRVEFVYAPTSVKTGAALSLAGALASGLLTLLPRWRVSRRAA